MPKTITAALAELRDELGNGTPLTADLVNTISREYGVRVELLLRKANESGITARGSVAAREAERKARTSAQADRERRAGEDKIREQNRVFMADLRDFFRDHPQHVPSLLKMTGTPGRR
jgi:hypothetical protein